MTLNISVTLHLKPTEAGNYGHYSNAEVDALIDQLDQEFDQRKTCFFSKRNSAENFR